MATLKLFRQVFQKDRIDFQHPDTKKTLQRYHWTKTNFKVVVAGASGGIGQPLALLMKMNPLVTHLALYDVAKVTPGVAKDLSHMNTNCKVTGHLGPDQICSAFKGADLVLITAGVPRKPGMTRDDLFNTNATIVRNFGYAVASACPCAITAIITNPINSVVPIFAEVMKKIGSHDPARVLGVTTLDVVRSATFVGEINGIDPATVNVPCIGGHAGTTIIPLLSQSNPPLKLEDKDMIKALTKRIQEAGTEVVKAKAGGGSATLSMAFAAARLGNSILRGLKGECDVVECAYVESCVTEANFFSNPVVFGPTGVVKNLGYGELNEMEQEMLKVAVPQLQKNIAKGIAFFEKPC